MDVLLFGAIVCLNWCGPFTKSSSSSLHSANYVGFAKGVFDYVWINTSTPLAIDDDTLVLPTSMIQGESCLKICTPLSRLPFERSTFRNRIVSKLEVYYVRARAQACKPVCLY
uniref:Uncharacterized protein n=1 Tax=Palpitomonas bilix TaxID=652834 RepID=A0A7S3G4D3_9EUKA